MSHSFPSLRLANLNYVLNGLSLLFLFQVVCNFQGREIIVLENYCSFYDHSMTFDILFIFLHVDMYPCCEWACVHVS